MTKDDVTSIERELRISVPSDYRALVTDYPPELFQHAADFDLMDAPARVVEMNRQVRTGPFYGVTWPAQYFAIGENGCGDYYCLDLSRSSSPVIFFDHEKRSFVERAPSLQEWWPMVVREYEQT
jgi:SMI1 / KNR4 family (SUKH-1)